MNIFKLLVFIFTAFSSISFSSNEDISKPFEGFSLGLTSSVDMRIYDYFHFEPFFGPSLEYNYYTDRDSYIHLSVYFPRAVRLISMALGGSFLHATRHKALFPEEFNNDTKDDKKIKFNTRSVWVSNSMPDVFLGSSFLLNRNSSLGFGFSFVDLVMGIFTKYSFTISDDVFLSIRVNYSYFMINLLDIRDQELSFQISVNYNF